VCGGGGGVGVIKMTWGLYPNSNVVARKKKKNGEAGKTKTHAAETYDEKSLLKLGWGKQRKIQMRYGDSKTTSCKAEWEGSTQG